MCQGMVLRETPGQRALEKDVAQVLPRFQGSLSKGRIGEHWKKIMLFAHPLAWTFACSI